MRWLGHGDFSPASPRLYSLPWSHLFLGLYEEVMGVVVYDRSGYPLGDTMDPSSWRAGCPLWLSVRLANGQFSAHYNHLMFLFTVITMHCWWHSLCWPCSWTSKAFKASDLYFWTASWRVEIELDPCFCGSPGCKLPQAQWYPLQMCCSEPTEPISASAPYILHSQPSLVIHLCTLCAGTSLFLRSIWASIEIYQLYWLVPSSPVLSAWKHQAS